MSKKTTIGGQALIEGIMMKGPRRTVMAVRNTSGEIITEEVKGANRKLPKIAKVPVIRGIVNYVLTMIDGYKCLMRSAELSGFADLENAEEERKAAEKRADKARKKALRKGLTAEEAETEANRAAEEKPGDSAFMNAVMIAGSVLGVALAFMLFMYVPSLIFDFANGLSGEVLTPFKALFEGVIKIAIFVLYLFLVSFMKDIRRTFMFHGAEHKTIFCYEAGEELTVENVRKQSRLHPRCGTSFLIIMLVVGILVSFVLVSLFPVLKEPSMRIIWVGAKLISIPLICGFAYELIKICGRYDNVITRIISAPGMWLQKITTKEPYDGMIEVAIVAMREVIPENSEEDDWK